MFGKEVTIYLKVKKQSKLKFVLDRILYYNTQIIYNWCSINLEGEYINKLKNIPTYEIKRTFESWPGN